MIELAEDATEAEAYEVADAWLRRNLPGDALKAALDADWATVAAFLADPERGPAWHSALGAAGLSTPTWPKEWGGLGLSARAAGAVAEAVLRYRVDRGMSDFVGLALAGPTIIVHGTPEQKRRFLGPLARGEHRWCQLFSEPGAGSDLAGLSTRAVRQDDGTWLVNGQKVWSSFAHVSDYGLLMARTDPALPKHKGISYFLVNMRTPGVDARPLKQMTGDAEFNEVFLTDVHLPADALLGEVNGGWAVAITTLMQERNGLTGLPAVGPGRSDELLRRARDNGTLAEPVLRDELLRLVVEERVLQMTTVRSYAESGRDAVGAEGSIRKLVHAQFEEAAASLAAEVAPLSALAWDEGRQNSEASYEFLAMKQTSIAGGTSEIQRNIIAERILGLPKDPDPEKDVPFNERRRGG
ncbi:acyl-CoA dehydrogenase family protein [Actinomadura sp. BRA 177]|uniref:acyl-CoA dehydrogenase family protein n=1 Tax=Actinomadura sp. BRA 177 TaxID=2745202 RepID=UPI001595F504|nr:acyl-CoA dehydrogenase family protein [Actinomadura sp. BRA 177]NVI89063.1 acyl-CoA dehydrogenase family protein [Actinomadura sp. BRA 177]